MENDRGTLPGNAVLPVIIGGVDRSASEHASDGARGIRTIVRNATPNRRRANITSVVVGNECLHTHKLRSKMVRNAADTHANIWDQKKPKHRDCDEFPKQQPNEDILLWRIPDKIINLHSINKHLSSDEHNLTFWNIIAVPLPLRKRKWRARWPEPGSCQ